MRWKIGLLVTAGLLGIFALFGVLGVSIVREDEQRMLNERLAIARASAAFLDAEMDEQFQELEAAAARLAAAGPGGARPDAGDVEREPEGIIINIFLMDGRGARWAEDVEPSDAAAVEAMFAGSELPWRSARYISGVRSWGEDGHPVVIMSVPVRTADGARQAALGAVLDVTHGHFGAITASARGVARTGHAELIDQNGTVVASSDPGRVLGAAEHPEFFGALLRHQEDGSAVTAPTTGAGDGGERHVMTFVPLEVVPWGLSLGGSETELAVAASHWRNQVLLFGGLLLALSLLVVWLTTRSVALPVQALTLASRRIAAGDLRTPVRVRGEGELRVLAKSFDDMREHLRQALAALAMEKSRYEGIVGSMADAVITTDLEQRITGFNPAASGLTGWLAERAIGRPYDEVVRPAGPKEAGERVHDGVVKEAIRRSDERQVVVATSRSPVRDQAGNVAGYVHVLRDVSAEEQVNQLKEEFLSTISHELRTPLGYVKGYASTLLLPNGLSDEAVSRHCLEVIVQSSDELTELVDNLLDMSKIGAGVLSVSPSPTRLRPLVRAAVERAGGRAGDHRFQVLVPASLPRVLADPHRVEQVLFNLLDNAIKYSPPGSRIVVDARAQDGEMTVAVSDEGAGIAQEELSTIFERFQRGAAARRQRVSGSGLGLAICRGIVSAHGGRIWAESPAPGQAAGSRLSFTLPLAQPFARSVAA